MASAYAVVDIDLADTVNVTTGVTRMDGEIAGTLLVDIGSARVEVRHTSADALHELLLAAAQDLAHRIARVRGGS